MGLVANLILAKAKGLSHLDTPLAALIAAHDLEPALRPVTSASATVRAISCAAHWVRYAELVAANMAVVTAASPAADSIGEDLLD